MRDVVIVGGSLAGLTTAEALRERGYAGRITIVGEEPHPPYSRPPLSKQFLTGSWGVDEVVLRDAAQLDRLEVSFLRGRAATGLDLARRVVEIGTDTVPFDELVIATGVRARKLPGGGSHVRTLRTLEDALGLRDAILRANRVAVVGAGVLGRELASAVLSSGRQVVLVGAEPGDRGGGLPSAVSRRMLGLLADRGAELRLGVTARAAEGGGIRLSDAGVVDADVVIAAIGSCPAVEWVRTTGIKAGDGVECDPFGRVAPNVWAVGDVAAWQDARTGARRRIEHQLSAIEQAHAVARTMMTGVESRPIAPFFWTEVCGTRVLMHGSVPEGAQLRRIAGRSSAGEVLAACRDGRVHALIGWNAPREFRAARKQLLDGDAAMPHDDWDRTPA